jgi:photosystem II stability/assembly factor-like uncharacterized protein
MSVVAPPEPPRPDELEALIREARARQRRRRLIAAATIAVAGAVSLSAWAAIPGLGDGGSASGGSAHVASSRGIDNAGRVPIVEVGTSGGVTWAINGLGMWLTADGGRTWRTSAPKHVREMGDLIARVEQVDFLDRRDGWLFAVDVKGGLHPAYARHAELDWTSDGGRTWHWTMPRGCCGDVSFLTPRRGFFLGASRLLSTTDGGRSWKPVARTPFRWGVPTFVDARHGVAVVGKGRLFSTSDGGKRWVSVHVPLSEGVLPNVARFGNRLVVPAEIVGPPTTRLVVYVSDDGGVTWQAHPAPKWWVPVIGSSDPSEFSAASSSVWYAVGWRKLAVTTNGGRTWRLVKVADLPARWTISAIDFTSPLVGWAVFQHASPPNESVLMRTTDGGVHWAPAGPRTSKRHRR